MKTEIIKTKGMHCKSCEMLISDSLGEQPGVAKVEASAKDNKVKVEYDEKKIGITKLKDLIKAEGYEVL
jgi:copper chaperone CopZ